MNLKELVKRVLEKNHFSSVTEIEDFGLKKSLHIVHQKILCTLLMQGKSVRWLMQDVVLAQ